jgi:hypothetical protein
MVVSILMHPHLLLHIILIGYLISRKYQINLSGIGMEDSLMYLCFGILFMDLQQIGHMTNSTIQNLKAIYHMKQIL